MNDKNPGVDNYIMKSREFARPILEHLRELVHKACPEVKESIKWSFPVFDYAGSILCNMASFKEHCAFGFWRTSELDDPDHILEKKERSALGSLGRITIMEDLPPDKILVKYIRNAMKLNEQGKRVQLQKNKVKKVLDIPSYLQGALNDNKAAARTFDNFSYSNKKDYVDWLNEAKTEATRDKRLADTIRWLSEGKTRNWKYIKKK